jgi:hypothetical protein
MLLGWPPGSLAKRPRPAGWRHRIAGRAESRAKRLGGPLLGHPGGERVDGPVPAVRGQRQDHGILGRNASAPMWRRPGQGIDDLRTALIEFATHSHLTQDVASTGRIVMGRILPFPTRQLPSYPAEVGDLATAEAVFLIALRCWVADRRQGADPLPRLRGDMSRAGAHDAAASSVDHMMRVIARSAWRQVEIGCPRCTNLTPDELCLLHAASLAQAGETGRAEACLHAAMLSRQGAEFAMGPIEGLGEIFSDAELVFPSRSLPALDGAAHAPVEAWMPPPPPPRLH